MIDGLTSITARIKEIENYSKTLAGGMKPAAVSDFEAQLQSSLKSDETASTTETASSAVKGTGYHPFLTKSLAATAENQETTENKVAAAANSDTMGAINKKINEVTKKYGIDEKLLRSVIKVESAFDPFAVSKAGAMGLMQLMPKTALEMGVSKPFDIDENIEGGAKYLRLLLDKYNGDVTKSLAAYNAGPQTVDAVNGVPEIDETQNYVKKITGLLATDTDEEQD